MYIMSDTLLKDDKITGKFTSVASGSSPSRGRIRVSATEPASNRKPLCAEQPVKRAFIRLQGSCLSHHKFGPGS